MGKALLSIDGGGIRGIIPLCALIELEKQTQKVAREVFSFMAGTSTGAIILAGLAVGMSAEEILKLYQGLGPKVFRRDWLGWLFSLGSFRYRTEPLAEVIQQVTGEVSLNELPVEILIPAIRVVDGRAWYFVRDNPSNASTTGKLKLVDCVTASAAAPTYFEPWDVPTVGPSVDGGVGIAGNPSYKACVEAFYFTPSGSYIPSETVVVSLGTGRYDGRIKPANLVDWANWTIGSLLRAPAEQQTELVQRHFADAATYRIDTKLPRDIGLDAIKAIPELIEIGQKFAAEIDWMGILASQDTHWRVEGRSSAARPSIGNSVAERTAA
jgi:patatin-like phospholipase/acyl hydrolase